MSGDMKKRIFVPPPLIQEGRARKIESLKAHGWSQGGDGRWRHPKRRCNYSTRDAIGLEGITGSYEKERAKKWKDNRKK